MKHRLLILFTCLFVLSILPTQAQQRLKFNVASFKQDPLDLSARNEEFKKMDSNGTLYAIIKVQSDVDGDDLESFRFNFGMMNSFVELHDDLNELWVYVQKNAKTVTISREGYTTISKYDLKTTISAGATYLMHLSVQTPKVQHRILQFKVSPVDESALVKVKREDSSDDYELWGSVDASGSIDRRLETGTYLYEVAAENYEVSEGRIVLTNGDTNHVEEVILKPNFGWLEIEDVDGITGAEFYVDNRKIGSIPYKEKKKWPVRNGYRLMISAGELYKTYNSTFDIRKGEVTRLEPHLESNFAKTTIVVDGDEKADIYVNGTRRGTGRWNGPLKAGAYSVECRRENHRSTTTQIIVKNGEEESFSIAAPTPITGSIYVTTQPSGARVSLDGVDRGQSPMELKDILIGAHELKVVLSNYKAEQQNVTVKEGKTEEARFTLRDFAAFKIVTNPPGAQLTVDGRYVGNTPCSFDGASGEYDIQLLKSGFTPYRRKVQLNSSSPMYDVNLSKQYLKPSCFYAQVGMQVGSFIAAELTLGTYYRNFNIEGFFLYGLSSSEDIYWNYTGTTHSSSYLHSIYSPKLAYGGKVGYGFLLGNRLRLTPQLGGTIISLHDDGGYTEAYAVSGTLGARLDVVVIPSVGLFVTPGLAIPVMKSDVYKRISDSSSVIQGWSSGFNAKAGICLFF